MATGPGTNQGKTAFVERYLSGNLDADLDTVNEAWTSAGNDGTVSESLVSKTRSRLRREGVAEVAPAAKAKAKSPAKAKAKAAEPEPEVEDTPAEAEPQGGEGPSKSAFVQETLGRDPSANVKEVNRLWSEAGHEGKISDSIFYKAKREIGQPGEAAADEPASAAEPESRPSAGGGEAVPQSPEVGQSAAPGKLGQVVDEVEAGIDDLMFTLKASGGMPEVEAALRAARRLLVRGQED